MLCECVFGAITSFRYLKCTFFRLYADQKHRQIECTMLNCGRSKAENYPTKAKCVTIKKAVRLLSFSAHFLDVTQLMDLIFRSMNQMRTQFFFKIYTFIHNMAVIILGVGGNIDGNKKKTVAFLSSLSCAQLSFQNKTIYFRCAGIGWIEYAWQKQISHWK